jgi:hypothetical protein
MPLTGIWFYNVVMLLLYVLFRDSSGVYFLFQV